jgi:hypothetical protein
MKRSDKTDLHSEFKAMRERKDKTTKEVLHTKDGQELQSLRNALSSLNLTGYEIFQSQTSKYQYCLIDDRANYLTGFWNYTNLNHFIMGYGKAVNERQKLLDSNRDLQAYADYVKRKLDKGEPPMCYDAYK